MSRKYSFARKESDGKEFVIAQPRSGNQEPVRLDSKWVDSDDIEGEWEEAIRSIIREDLLSGMELEQSKGSISRRRAVEILTSESEGDEAKVTSEEQAEALLEFFNEENIIEFEGNDILLLKDPFDDNTSKEMMLNWAAGINACVDKIDGTIERVEAARDKLQDRGQKMESGQSEVHERLRETAQRLKSLGDGEGVPKREELPDDMKERYESLKREYVVHQKMVDVIEEDLTKKIQSGTTKLAQQIRELKSQREALEGMEADVRNNVLYKGIFPEEAENMVKNIGDVATNLAGMSSIDEDIDNLSHEELEQGISEILGETKDTLDNLEETTGQERDEEVDRSLEI